MTDPALLRDALSAAGSIVAGLAIVFGFWALCVLVNERQEKRRARAKERAIAELKAKGWAVIPKGMKIDWRDIEAAK